MASVVRVSVDGQNGATLAQQNGVRTAEDERQVAIRTLDGAPGLHAAPAVAGSPGGSLVIEITESQEMDGYLHAHVVNSVSRQRPPTSVEVPIGRDLLLSARGGNGEAGRNGTDGQPGRDGRDGIPASRDTDATEGTDAGNGGDAGHGSSGAIGGNGGTIDVLVNENDTHLLMAVQSDVSGGLGGDPGLHGQPGAGGKGGKGGEGHKWDETIGYRYYCTDQCVGRGEDKGSTRSEFGANARALVSSLGTEAVQGRELQAMITRVAASYGAQRRLNVDPGRCKCGGGSGNCVGCGYRPIVKSFQRAQALNGKDGQGGTAATNHLVAGPPGQAGLFRILVRDQEMNVRTYESCFQLELVDFELEDENGDGIFEPGEHVLVQRIRVRNTGGMPSPTCAIPISVVKSDDLSPDDDNEAEQLHLPASIEPGTTVTLDGSCRALIIASDDPPKPGVVFKRRVNLSLTATMPWLDRRLSNFDLSQPFQVEYPCEIQEIQCLASLAQGDLGRITWKVYNKASTVIGPGSQRMIQMDVRFPSDYGSLVPNGDASLVSHEQDQMSQNADDIESRATTSMQQLVKVASNCTENASIPVDLLLYMDDPFSSNEPNEGENKFELRLAQHSQIFVQISRRHYFNPTASMLLVINSKTPQKRVNAIRTFVEKSLGMAMDTWNVDIYGGLSSASQDEDTLYNHIFERYRSKVIILVGNQFQFFDGRDTTILSKCDPNIINQEAAYGTSFLFLESNDDEGFKQLVKLTICAATRRVGDSVAHTERSAHMEDQRELISTVAQETLQGSFSSTVYSIRNKRYWYTPWRTDIQAAHKATKTLQKELPQIRCIVSTAPPGDECTVLPTSEGSSRSGLQEPLTLTSIFSRSRTTDGSRGSSTDLERIHVYVGPARNVQLTAAARRYSQASAQLDEMEQYSIVAALSTANRASMIWSPDSEEQSVELSPMILDAATCSLKIALADEIKQYLRSSARPSATYLSHSSGAGVKSFLKLHLPTINAIFECRYATSSSPLQTPSRIQSIFRHALACCQPQKKRHVVTAIANPLVQRRKELRSLLVEGINRILLAKDFSEGDLETWHAHARTLHSTLKASKRNTHKSIRCEAAELTKTSEHGFKTGLQSNVEIVPNTEYYDRSKLKSAVADIEGAVTRLREDEERAHQQLDLLTVEEGEASANTTEISERAETEGETIELPEHGTRTPAE